MTTAAEHSPSEPPAALAYSADNCTIGRAMGILGEKWTFLVLREVVNGIRRFDDMRARTGINRQVLTDRLARLVEQDVLTRVPYQVPGSRPRHEYRLTVKGFDLYRALVAIADWGDRYLADPEGPPIRFEHRDCGEQVHSVLMCDEGHRVEDPRAVLPTPGPGVRLREA